MIRRLIVPLLSGTIFGAGLTIGGMTDPARVQGFLDLFGNWDPTLAFVMGGAVLVMALAWLLQRRMQRPAFAETFALPDARDITPRLVGGSALFGVGWGIAGLCPGPGFAALAIAPAPAAIFLAAMLTGTVLARWIEGRI